MDLIRKATWEEDIKLALDFDGDYSGENGPGYTDQEALENGFQSNIEYSIHKAKERHTDWQEAVKSVLKDFVNHPSNIDYYDIVLDYVCLTVLEGLVVHVEAINRKYSSR